MICVLSVGEEVRLREGDLRNAGTGIHSAKFGDDVVEVVLRAEALPFEHFDNRRNLPHVGDGRVFEGHGVTVWGGRCSWCTLVYVEGCLRLRDHCLPQATSHRAWLILSGSIDSQLSLPTSPSACIPVPIRCENSVKASNRRRCSAQSNCLCVSVDINRVGLLALPCIHLKSINCRIVTRFPSL